MSAKTSIAWATMVWNPTTGCRQISPGCDHCYAKRTADTRMRANPRLERFGHPFEDVLLHHKRLWEPQKWRAHERVFVNSMSDLFHRDVPDEFIAQVFVSMAMSEQHSFLILTKRAERLTRAVERAHAAVHAEFIGKPLPLFNVWLGVSVESNDYAWRVEHLKKAPAAIRFLSIEPLLGPVDAVNFVGIDWVIIGGESGPHRRDYDPDWMKDAIARCLAAKIPVFVKQDAGAKPGLQGRLPDEVWALKQFPRVEAVPT